MMNDFYADLKVNDAPPDLWVRYLALYAEEGQEPTRTIELRRGVNVIWAHEPQPKEANSPSELSGLDSAGHGVGKTSFCLLLRHCLCDTSKAIELLKEILEVEFPKGGVAAVVSVAGEDWTVYRPYAKNHHSFALHGNRLTELFTDSANRAEFGDYEKNLSNKLLKNIKPKVIPSTGQSIKWKQILSWLTRDQAARFASFYSWREGDGTGLKRQKLDPPILFRAILGIISELENDLLIAQRKAEDEKKNSEEKLEELRKKPEYLVAHIEKSLREWGGFPENIPFYKGDLLEIDVINSINNQCLQLESSNHGIEVKITELEELQENLVLKKKNAEIYRNGCKLEFEKFNAVIEQNINAFNEAKNKKEKLLNMQDFCPVCGLLYSQCEHVKEEAEKIDIKAKRDQQNFSTLAGEYAKKLPEVKSRLLDAENHYTTANNDLAGMRGEITKKRTAIINNKNRAANARELIKNYGYWKSEFNSNEDTSEIKLALAALKEKKDNTESLSLKLLQAKDQRTEREKILSDIFDGMAKNLLGDQAFGYVDGDRQDSPFILSVQGGEAYKVLSVLLGDYAALIFSTIQRSGFPGFLLHDCPREADMSEGLYHHALDVMRLFEQKCYKNTEAGFQYIFTTTTPPPSALRESPYCVLPLAPDDPHKMLFRRRFGGISNNERLDLQVKKSSIEDA